MSEGLIVKSKIKDYAEGLSVSSEFEEALMKKAEETVKEACRRAKGNGRRTLMARDL